MSKSVRIIVVCALFLLLVWSVPAGAWQGKQEEKGESARQEQQAKPERQQEDETPRTQQQAKPEHQRQAKAPQQQEQAKPEHQQQTHVPQGQQQAKRQQDQQHQEHHQVNSTRQQSQQANGGQQGGHQQAASSHRPERTQQAMAAQRAQPALRLSSRGSGRIPDQRFHTNFGREHEFRMGNPVFVSGYSRFQYGGYWFGFVEPWPVGWYYTDDVYIDYIDGGYYMFDPYYPGVRFAISVVL